MSSDTRVVAAIAVGAIAAVAVLLVALGGSDGGDDPAAGGGAPPPTSVPLDELGIEELERVVAEHPTVVEMRLELVERYLRASRLEEAQQHADEAAVRAETVGERARALRYLGWTTALLGDPAQGEGIIVQSLALDPDDRDALYFLGRVRYEGLGRPDLAVEPLEQLAAMDMDADQRRLVEELLADVRVAAATEPR